MRDCRCDSNQPLVVTIQTTAFVFGSRVTDGSTTMMAECCQCQVSRRQV